ncbi:hypothetical protein O181_022373 [Austropuccinia psidii MF-1]|uniref:Uncharacterized protein n=1 Tax=Austropuccinia psidii MF-1 TaxID=1389203 RepID=A0A9Q3CF27_9BASI|nr:hypothetical protein [Austropuccinia psidii MF-1]
MRSHAGSRSWPDRAPQTATNSSNPIGWAPAVRFSFFVCLITPHMPIKDVLGLHLEKNSPKRVQLNRPVDNCPQWQSMINNHGRQHYFLICLLIILTTALTTDHYSSVPLPCLLLLLYQLHPPFRFTILTKF